MLLWFRRDLRLHDNPALVAAAAAGGPVVPLFLWNSAQEQGPGPAGHLVVAGAARVWLEQALVELALSLQREYGAALVYRSCADYADELVRLVQATGARELHLTALYEPFLAQRDEAIFAVLRARGVAVHVAHSYLLHRPEAVCTDGVGTRGLGSVSHFMACCRNGDEHIGVPVDAPSRLQVLLPPPASHGLPALRLAVMPRRANGRVVDWAAEMRRAWDFSEAAGLASLEAFLDENLEHYTNESSRADQPWTAHISPYLHWGQLSPRTVLHAALRRGRVAAKFRRKLAWRDLSYWQLWLFPNMDTEPIRVAYAHMCWNTNADQLRAWQRGTTGYPLVDAAMRQLWRVGWINNYMRHVVASFLIAYLRFNWTEGYNWFQYTLLDSDMAIDAMMWQNGGMSGLDHWNFVMHPVDAALTCDPDGAYVRRWVPELAQMPAAFVHQPWACSEAARLRAGVVMGTTYPHRVLVDLAEAREQSLADVVAVRRSQAHWVDRQGNDMIVQPPGLRPPTLRTMPLDEDSVPYIPLITRREFKYRTANPAASDNPHSAVLKGYVSRRRDEAVAERTRRDFATSTISECEQRHSRGDDFSSASYL